MNGRRLSSHSVRAAALALLSAANALAAPLSEMEARGKQIYLAGIDKAEPEPKVFIGVESMSAPARLAPCGSCHGEDGRGRPEGNITPPDITWDRLSDTASQRGATPEAIIVNALEQGVGHEGKRLGSIMPRYALSPEQMLALHAYLKIIATDQAPGVGTEAIRIAVILPAKRASAAYDVLRQMSLAYFEALNAKGGVFNRRIDAIAFDADQELDALKDRIRSRDIFALILLDGSAQSDDLTRLAEETRTPLIAAGAKRVTSRSRNHFSIFPDIATQMRVLVDFVAQASERARRTAIIYIEEETTTEIREAIERQFTKWGLSKPIELAHTSNSLDARVAVARLSREAVDSVIFLDGGGLAAFADALKASDWRPHLLIPSSAIGPTLFDAPTDISEKMFFPLPLIADQSAKDPHFRALREKFDIPRHHTVSQVAAYCASLMLVEGLKLAGRDISHAKFIESLESLRDFDTGVSHRLSFDSNHHVGNDGAYIFGVEASARRFIMVSEWRAPR